MYFHEYVLSLQENKFLTTVLSNYLHTFFIFIWK